MKLMFKFKDGMIVENDVGDGNESGNGEIFSMFAKGKMSNATISINGQEERK